MPDPIQPPELQPEAASPADAAAKPESVLLADRPVPRARRNRKSAKDRRKFAPDTAGALMHESFMALPAGLTVSQALKRLRSKYSKTGEDRAVYVYTVNDDHVLVGVLQLRHLVTQPSHRPLKQIHVEKVVSINHGMAKTEVARLFLDHNYLALPVVDDDRRLLGVISSADLIDLIQETSSDEMMKMQGVALDETRALPVTQIMRRRVSWLSLNIVLNLISASIIALYAETLQAVIALAVFLPIISDISGVSGMQAVAVSVRDLALGRVKPKDLASVLWLEVRIGFFNGLILGLEIGLVALLWKRMPMLGVVVAISLWLNTIIAVCIGSSLPLVLKKFKLDPAIVSGPILTTVTDLMGFLIMLSLASHFIAWLK